MKRLLLIILMLATLAGVFGINPGSASATENAPAATEISAAPASPASEATVSQTTVRHTSSSEVIANLARGARRKHVQHTWRAYFAGLQVYWYRIDVTFTYNGRRVWDVDSSRQGDGSWGWGYCGSDPAGEEWIGIDHHAKRAYGFGHFGQYPISPGCIFGSRILGGSVNVSATGYTWVRNGTCCD